MKKILNFNGLMVELSRWEIYEGGTPAVVSVVKAGREYTATLECALDTATLEDSSGKEYNLSRAQMKWLESIVEEAEKFLSV